MKRIFFMFLALLLCVMVQAQDNVEITLNNGNVVKGVTKTLFMLDDGDVVVAKDSKYREKKEYKSTEIKSIKYYDSKSKEWIKFVPLMAQKSLPSVWNKNPKPYKTPIFLKPVYEGKMCQPIYTLSQQQQIPKHYIWKAQTMFSILR